MKRITAVLMLLLACSIAHAQDAGWEQWKQRFVLPEGRVVDDGNNQISHSEGQGYGMLLAEMNDDPRTFAALWGWTAAHLQRKDNDLFSWRYDPKGQQVSDRNDATDGDVLIAWALLRAGQRWHNRSWLQSSEKVQRTLLRMALVTQAGRLVMLPGLEGFRHKDVINLNPSYFIFPAWQAFSRYSHSQQWQTLIDDGLALVSDMRFGQAKVPTDWVAMDKAGSLSPAKEWPARFSYDAVRIPLYLNWYRKGLPQNRIFTRFWGTQPRENTPAWTDVASGEEADYPLSGGMRAVRDLALGEMRPEPPTLSPQDDYYSASLKLLAFAAAQAR